MQSIRDITIETTLSNYVMAGVISLPIEMSGLISQLSRLTDKELALALVQSRIVSDKALEARISPN